MRHLTSLAPAVNPELVASLDTIDAPDKVLEAMLMGFHEPVYLKDRFLRLVVANPAFCRMMGARAVDMLGQTLDIHFDQEVREALLAADRAALEGGEVIAVQVSFRSAELAQERRFCVAKQAMRDPSGSIIGVLSHVRDITERSEATRLMAQAKDNALRQEASMSKFLASASHDLRQPLQAVFLFAAALSPFVSERGRVALAGMNNSLEALKSLLDGLLDVSSLDSEIVHPVIEEFLVSEVLRPVVMTFEPMAREKKLVLATAVCEARVRSDRTLLERMLTNLVHNAIRFTPSGQVLIECLPLDSKLDIIVTDTGIGIPPDQHNAVFDEFHQVENAQRDRARGPGLGLSVVRRLSKLLAHEVRLESDIGQGTRVTIEVPLVGTALPPAPLSVHDAEAHRTRPFAVLVDDDAFLREAFAILFEDFGFDIVIAASSSEAIEMLDPRRPPDVLVVDYRLVGETGVDAARRIRTLYGREVPGILLTGDIGRGVEQCAAEAHLMLMHKPINTAILEAALTEAIHSAALILPLPSLPPQEGQPGRQEKGREPEQHT